MKSMKSTDRKCTKCKYLWTPDESDVKKVGHIVECVKNAVKKEVYMWKKTLTFSINRFYVVVVGLITNDIVKDV